MTYNFDEEINRLGTSSVKWEYVVDGWEFKHGDHEAGVKLKKKNHCE